MKERFDIQDNRNHVSCRMFTGTEDAVCTCEISVNKISGTWNITLWHTREGFKHKGYGKRAMQEALWYCKKSYGMPSHIQYTWNGANEYVLTWLEQNFNAVCTCPIAVQKNESADDWSSHIYELDRDKVFLYFGI